MLLVILVGLTGILVPVMPGTSLVLGVVAVWAFLVSTPTAWVVLAVATVLLAVGGLTKYLLPGRRLRFLGVPWSTLWAGGLTGLVGMVVIPVVGLVIGFVAGVYVAERRRLGPELARPSTSHAVRAVGVSILIELTAALAATAAWGTGVAVAPAA